MLAPVSLRSVQWRPLPRSEEVQARVELCCAPLLGGRPRFRRWGSGDKVPAMAVPAEAEPNWCDARAGGVGRDY